MSSFARDLAEGKAAEKRMGKKLVEANHYKDVQFYEGTKLEYDAEAETPEGNKEFLEFKSDRMSALTGNFFVEFWCRDHSSGIDATLAHYYVVEVFNPAAIYKIPTSRLRELVKGCKVVAGGDEQMAQGYLLPVRKIPAEFKL